MMLWLVPQRTVVGGVVGAEDGDGLVTCHADRNNPREKRRERSRSRIGREYGSVTQRKEKSYRPGRDEGEQEGGGHRLTWRLNCLLEE
jgi:hypothetical protein